MHCSIWTKTTVELSFSAIIIIAVECGDPGKPTNGKQIVKKGYVYGGSVKFVCDKNYTLVGTDVMHCQANRSWSSPVPNCLGKCHGYKETVKDISSTN